ncbi:MAG: hypothetical protein DDT42_02003 [candidate division WS2 bacterium]|uniref:D-galactarate/Altronate dehydratase C-terminal domain-containing protein n=1 Tax=Psychracetigena formicireducens TaxID=2986056 RepID=A0A9E2BJ99_PSYF1|nr:hypothetical protein [Candidatus Psychracetigena formicireducens]
MPDIVDFDCGKLISTGATLDELALELLSLIIKTASGEYNALATVNNQFDFIP